MNLEEFLAALAAGTLEMPVEVEVLSALRDAAINEITEIQTAAAADPASVDVDHVNSVVDAVEKLQSAIAEATLDDADHQADIAAALARATAVTTPEADEVEVVEETEDEPIEAEVVETRELVTAAATTTKAPAKKPVFKGKGPKELPPEIEETQPVSPAWVVSHGAPGFDDTEYGSKVGFKRMGDALDTVTKGRGVGRLSGVSSGPKFRQSLAKMSRGLKVIESERDLVDEINRATSQVNGVPISTAALVAAGGWCAPSEQIYTFCDIPEAGDLISLPEIAIRRGGLRWPVEPDLTSLFESFEFFFTEPQLEAVDGNGDPTAIKHCVEIPCPDEFEELRLNAVGYCVEAGILQRQGWPESIEYVLRALTQEHMRAMSRRTILDMWNGGGAAKVFSVNFQVGATSGVLNALDLYATNLRLSKGYNKTYPMEIVAPSWFFGALRADMAMMEGVDTKYVTDGQIQTWLSARNISGQFVADWQTRDVSLPGHLDTVRWPGHIDIMMYPAGTWFRHLSNIIEVGVLYPKEQLQVNRYTEFFTEDAIAVGKRCDRSVNLRIPLNINGGYGAPVVITYADTAVSDGGGKVGDDPIDSGQVGQPVKQVLSYTGTLATGTFKLSKDGSGESATIPALATAAQVKTALVDLVEDWGTDDVTVTGGPLGTANINIVHPGGTLTVTSSALTGGSSPVVLISAPVDDPAS